MIWRTSHEQWFLLRVASRAFVAAAIVSAFVLFAWRADPGPTLASPDDEAVMAHDGAASRPEAAQSHVELGLIGSLEGRDGVVRIFATERGPRYTLFSKTGELLGADLYEEELEYINAGLTIRNMFASPLPMGALADTPEID